MKANDVRARNERDWDISLLRYELGQLQREREHLFSKRNERPLNSFEQDRANAIEMEMTDLIRNVVGFNRQLKGNASI